MNDIEKAIDALKMDNALMEFDPNTGEERPIGYQNEFNQYVYKANLLAILALEKQSPKKPVKDREYTLCPNCKRVEIDWLDKYCHGCGQAIDWSVGECMI